MAEAAYAPVTETLAPVVGPTPEEIERRKLMAAALLKQAMGSEPIGHWTQGVSNIVQALVAGRMEKKAGEEDAAAQAETWRNIAASSDLLFGGGGDGGEYADVPGAEAVSSEPDAATMQHISGKPPAQASYVYNGMLKRGMNPVQAAAWTASAQQESGFNPNANNPGEGARGHIQWRGDRLRNLQAFAAKRGKPWNDLDTQMDFGLWEMQNTEREAGEMFRAAQTPEEANQALKRYIRYGDKAGPAGSAGWDYRGRLSNTQRILRTMGGGETADIPGAEPVGSAPSPDVAQFLGQPPAQPEASVEERRALIAKALGGPAENPADVAAEVRQYYANEPPEPRPRPPTPARTPYAEPMSAAPSPDVMAHITGGGATPARLRIEPAVGNPAVVPAPALPSMTAGRVPDPRLPITGAEAAVAAGGVVPAAAVGAPDLLRYPPQRRPVYGATPPRPIPEQIAEQAALRIPPVPAPPPSPAPRAVPEQLAEQALLRQQPPPPVAAPPLAARVPQPRPAPPVAPAAPTTTGAVAAPAPARPVYSPPVKNDYNAMPGRPPAALPMRPGQLMQEPYSGPMSAQEFARQGQAAMRARAAGQQPTGLAQAPTPGGQPQQPRRNLLQALLGRGGPQGQAGTPAAPVASGAPAGGTAAPMDPQRAAMARLLADPRVPDALKVAALKRMTPQERKLIKGSPGDVFLDPITHQPVASIPAAPEKGTDDQREYQQAVEQGYTGSFVDYMREMKKAGATTINTGTPEAGDAALRKKLGEQEGQRWSELKQAGLTSASLGQDFAALDELIGIAPQGPITGRLAQMFPGASDAGAAFQSVVQRVAPTLRIPGSGATSDIEYQGMLNSLPALQNRPEANRAIAEMMKAKADLNVERSEIITAYESGEIDASTARTQLAGIDRKSIMSPELKRILGGMGESAEAGTETEAPTQFSDDEIDQIPEGRTVRDENGKRFRKQNGQLVPVP